MSASQILPGQGAIYLTPTGFDEGLAVMLGPTGYFAHVPGQFGAFVGASLGPLAPRVAGMNEICRVKLTPNAKPVFSGYALLFPFAGGLILPEDLSTPCLDGHWISVADLTGWAPDKGNGPMLAYALHDSPTLPTARHVRAVLVGGGLFNWDSPPLGG
jgi:hypothetical protein